jgi:hypothetical protein
LFSGPTPVPAPLFRPHNTWLDVKILRPGVCGKKTKAMQWAILFH